MKAIKTTYNNVTQSYYLVCRNSDNKYQLIAELIIEFLIQKKKLLIILRK